jgi:hypothetical protein
MRTCVSTPDDSNTPNEREAPEMATPAAPGTPRKLPPAVRLQQNILYWRDKASPYHRHLSALAMVLGFLGDNYFFRHADVAEMQFLFVIYLLTASVSILVLHAIEARVRPEKALRWRGFLPFAAQFAFGGLWSALLIFYTHSAVFIASWPFLLLLVLVLVGNEMFSRYISRLVFSSVLLFFGLFASAIFLVPIYVHAMGPWVFALSSAVTIFLYIGYLRLLAWGGRETLGRQRLWIGLGALLILAALNALYFTGMLPPLPLVLRDSGIYHAIKKVGDVYEAKGEPQSWEDSWLRKPQVQHVAPGEKLFAFSAVFAPIALSTRIVHRWQYYSETRKTWLAMGEVSFNVNGGRDGGYRAYSRKSNPRPGAWRVDIGTTEGRLIGRLRFSVEKAEAPPPLVPKTIH